MHTGKSYRISEFLVWTKRKLFALLLIGITPVILYDIFGLRWIAIPWPVVGLLGTATAFIVGFKNTETYRRTKDAYQVWSNIINLSRAWALISRDYFTDAQKTQQLIYRHLAWLTVLRYQMREEKVWETTKKPYNADYQRYYKIPEKEIPLSVELEKYLSEPELKKIIASPKKTTQIMSLQSNTIKDLYDSGQIVVLQFVEMERSIKELFQQQGRSEEIKDVPYPRQYAIISRLFINLFCLLLPFGMLNEFENLNEFAGGLIKGHMVWLSVPFSVIISWMYASLEQVGESTENPFQGSANDVPISQMCRIVEIELREMLGEKVLPPPLESENNILL